MMRSRYFLIVILLGITNGFSQITIEEITIQNQAIQLPGTLSYPEEKKAPSLSGFMDLVVLIEMGINPNTSNNLGLQ